MRLYLSPDGVWTGTQADAKAHARDANTTWKEFEVPVDKAGLLSFLNEYRVGAAVPPVSSAETLADRAEVTVTPVQVDDRPAPSPLPMSIQTIPLEEAIWELPLEEAVKLGGIVMERIREFARMK